MKTQFANVSLALVLTMAALAPNANADFCWRQSYGRGVGTIPTNCGPGNSYDAGLCYQSCRPGFSGVGPVCWGSCPGNMSDHGAGCTKPGPYGRGAGYPWKFGDSLNNSGMISRCEGDNGRGNCEMDGAIAYPRCKPGYHKVGCCVCSPDCPAGFADTGATCIKPTYGRGVGTIPTACDGGKSYDAGLCYTGCNAGFDGVGPVCWGQCPAGFVNCGAGCASSASACAEAVTDQVVSVLDVAANIAITVATSGSGTAAKAAITTSARAAARKATTGISKAAARKAIKELAEKAGETIRDKSLEVLSAMAAGEDFDPYELDPTGIAQIVKAYNKPICNGAASNGGASGGGASGGSVNGANFEGQLLRNPSNGGIYFIVGARRRWIPDPDTFNALGFDWNRVRDQASVSAIPEGQNYPRLASKLVRDASSGGVYLIQNGSRRWVPDPNTFARMGLNWANVRDVSPLVMAAIPEGQALPRL